MVKLYGFECQSRVAVGIAGRKREVYEVGDKVLVTASDKLTLLRLGFKLVDEAEVEYTDVFEATKKSKGKAKKETSQEETQEEVETTEEETPQEETQEEAQA
jgi:hypothetical protein